jgi:hypothetical protein
MTMAAAIVTGASMLAFYGGALAQTGSAKTATQADFDLCNREAQASAGSASPGTRSLSSATTTPGGSTSSSMSTMPGRSTSGSTSSMPGSTGAGSTSSGAAGAGSATGGSSAGGSTLGSGSSVKSGSTSAGDAQLRGMAAAGMNDPAYQQAYRQCMTRRGF